MSEPARTSFPSLTFVHPVFPVPLYQAHGFQSPAEPWAPDLNLPCSAGTLLDFMLADYTNTPRKISLIISRLAHPDPLRFWLGWEADSVDGSGQQIHCMSLKMSLLP